MMKTVYVVIALLAGFVGWFTLSPLFIDRIVDEPLNLLLPDGELDMKAVMDMPAELRQSHRDTIMDIAANVPDSISLEDMPAVTPKVVSQGTFSDADAVHKGSGIALLYALPGENNVLRFEDFRVTNGPDLVVYLARHPAPVVANDVSDNGFLNLGELKGNVGNQNYTIPAGTDMSEYKSVVIWCELFGVLFSPASLTIPSPSS